MASIVEILLEIKNLKEEIKNTHLFKKPFYTTKEAATFLSVSVSYMQKIVASKQINHSRPTGKLIFIKRSDLEDFVMKNPIHSNDDIDSIVADNLLIFKTKSQ